MISKKEHTDDPPASANFFTNFAKTVGGRGPKPAPENAEQPDADGVFTDVLMSSVDISLVVTTGVRVCIYCFSINATNTYLQLMYFYLEPLQYTIIATQCEPFVEPPINVRKNSV